jgi:hypothetical protein
VAPTRGSGLSAWELPISVRSPAWRPDLGSLSWPRLTPAGLAQWHANGTAAYLLKISSFTYISAWKAIHATCNATPSEPPISPGPTPHGRERERLHESRTSRTRHRQLREGRRIRVARTTVSRPRLRPAPGATGSDLWSRRQRFGDGAPPTAGQQLGPPARCRSSRRRPALSDHRPRRGLIALTGSRTELGHDGLPVSIRCRRSFTSKAY